MTTLREFVETASRNIDTIFRRTGRIRPMVHCVTRDGDELIFPSTGEDKDTFALMMRALFELRDVVRYVMMDEAWMVEAGNDEAVMREAIKHGATASPARVEIVMFSAEDHAEGQLMAFRKIIRPEGKLPYLDPLQASPDGGMLSGRFVGLLPRKSTLQ